MKLLTPLLLACGAALIGGCATHQQLSREEQLKIQEEKRQHFEKYMTRTYSGVGKQQIIDAAQKLLLLTDGEDVSFQHSDNGFVANRNWRWYAVLAADNGVDRWTVKVSDAGNGQFKVAVIENTISYRTNQQAIYVYGHGVMNVGTPTTTEVHAYNENNALYQLFWRRLDYLLGKRTTWQTCDAFKKEIEINTEFTGNIRPLCGTLAKDSLPEELRLKS